MSLTDALLLEPHPFEIWIAKRTDGPSRNCAAKFRVELATGPFCRAHGPRPVPGRSGRSARAPLKFKGIVARATRCEPGTARAPQPIPPDNRARHARNE